VRSNHLRSDQRSAIPALNIAPGYATQCYDHRLHRSVAYSDAKVAIVTGLVWHGRQKMALERWTNPKQSRRMCTCEYGLQSCSGKSAGVAKRPRELISPPEIPSVTIRHFVIAVWQLRRLFVGGWSGRSWAWGSTPRRVSRTRRCSLCGPRESVPREPRRT
jgi:hypothetical protein